MIIKFFNQSIKKFLKVLDEPTAARIVRTLNMLDRFEHRLGMPHSKKIDTNLFELRINGKRKIRIIYCFHENQIVLLNIFIKKTQKIPREALLLAKSRLNSLEHI